MTRPVITALPAAPTRGEDPATFAAKANTFVAALPAYGTESNALGVFMENEADAAQASRIAAEAAQTAAEAAETAAEAAQAAAEAASTASGWVSGASYVAGDVVWSPITYLSYRANTSTSGTTDPSLSADWTPLATPSTEPGWVLLSIVTTSASATADVETTFDSTYDTYVIVATGVLPATNQAILQARLKINGSYQALNYVGHSGYPNSGTFSYSANVYTVAAPANQIQLGDVTGATNQTYGGVKFQMRVYDPASTTTRKQVDWDGSHIARAANDFAQARLFGSARYEGGNQALTGVRFLFSTGNIATGTFRLYGIRKV